MVDFILFVFLVVVFVTGFWCGKTFKTFGEMVDATTAKVKGWFN